jgi:hypothetical protein
MDHLKDLQKFQNCKSCNKVNGLVNKFCKKCVINTELSLVTYNTNKSDNLQNLRNKGKLNFI